jgi:hypothetical protein
VWFLRVRFVIFAPDSRREPSPPSGRKSTQPTVQILEASSVSFPNGVSISSAETYPTIAEAMTAAALKLLDMTDRLEALDRSEQPVGTSIG